MGGLERESPHTMITVLPKHHACDFAYQALPLFSVRPTLKSWVEPGDEASLCESRARFLHTQSSCLNMSLAWDRYSIVRSPCMESDNIWSLTFALLGKLKLFSLSNRLGGVASFGFGQIQPLPICLPATHVQQTQLQISTIVLLNLLLNRWDVHHKMRINFFTDDQRSVNWCKLMRQEELN